MLKAMNRKHTIDEYRRTIDGFRAARPDMGFSSDFIVGYPGETDADHAATVALVREVGFASAYSFKYSARPGTPAAAIQAALVRDDIAQVRLQELQAVIAEQGRAFNQGFMGNTVQVLVDRSTFPPPLQRGDTGGDKMVNVPHPALPLEGGGENLSPGESRGPHDNGERPPGQARGPDTTQLHGRTAHNQPIHFDGPADLFGQIVDVTVTGATGTALRGLIINDK
jgi:tRNA A37 methylthiotransferase MiaB